MDGANFKQSFECNQCNKVFKALKILEVHLQTHNTQLVKCPTCVPDKFITEHVLSKHLQNVHKPHRDISCEYPACEKKFKQRDVMKKHMQMIHLQELTGNSVRNLHYHHQTCNTDDISKNTCEICTRKFTCKKSLETHVHTVH